MDGTAVQPLHIASARVEDFQSLTPAVELDLRRITVIVGDNSKGKSAVLRALAAVAFNRAGGDFVTGNALTGKKQTRVTLRMGTGQVVTWTKPRNGGAVVDLDGQTITRAKGDYPPELAAVLGFRELELGTFKARLQFAGQFDRPFMLGSATGGQAAAVLCSVSRIDVVVAAIALARTDLREAEQTAKAAEAEADGLQVELDAMPDYAALLARAEALAAREAEREAAVQRLDEARALVVKVAKAEAFTVRWLALELLARTEALAEGVAQLAEIAALATTVRTRTPQAAIDVGALKARVERFSSDVAALGDVWGAVGAVGRAQVAWMDSAAKLSFARADLGDAEIELAEKMAEEPVCPTCGAPVMICEHCSKQTFEWIIAADGTLVCRACDEVGVGDSEVVPA